MPINNEGRLLLSEVLAKQVDTDWPAANTDYDLYVQDLIASGNVIANGLIIRNIEVSDNILTGNVTAGGITANTLTLDIITANTFNGLPPANLSLLTTDDLNEGTGNLYFTIERARNAYTEGQGIAISANGVISTRGDDTGLGAFNSGINLMANSFPGDSFQTVKTFPEVEGNSFIVFSILATNISDETAYLTGRFVFDSNNILFANLLEIPRYTSIEILQKPQIFKPTDSIEVLSLDASQTPANNVLSFYVSYQGSLDKTFNRSGLTIDDNQNHLVYDTSSRTSVIESINLVNLGSNVMPTTVTIVDSGDNLVTYLSSNLQVPPYSSVELCEYPKSLIDTHKIKVQKFDNPQQMSIFTSSKFTSSFLINPSSLTLDEDSSVQFDIITTNILDGTILYYEIEPITGNINQDDFITPLEGNVTIINNGVRLTVQANADLNVGLEFDESFRLVLRKGSNTGSIVALTDSISVKDVSNTITYSITSVPTPFLSEGGSLVFTIDHPNLPENTTLNWYTEGNVTSSTFLEGNSNVLVSSLHASNIFLNIDANAVPDYEELVFNLVLTDSESNVLARSANLTIFDSLALGLQATGGSNVIIEGNTVIHVFTTSDDFTITRLPLLDPVTVNYMIVGGGGGGQASPPTVGTPYSIGGAGAGAGGVLIGNIQISSSFSTPSPIPYSIIVGSGGNSSTRGSNSEAFGAIAFGGGTGEQPGGSGGGSRRIDFAVGEGVAGQGNPGGSGWTPPSPASAQQYRVGGGGGAGAAGTPNPGATGGIGIIYPISPSGFGTTGPQPGRYFAGGGGGGGTYGGAGGAGGGGNGRANGVGFPGTVNTGGGGGGGGSTPSNPPYVEPGGTGGSGIVIISYPILP